MGAVSWDEERPAAASPAATAAPMVACIKMLVSAFIPSIGLLFIPSIGLLLACTAGRRVAIKRSTEVWGPLLRVAAVASIAITQEFSDIVPFASVCRVEARAGLGPVELPVVEL